MLQTNNAEVYAVVLALIVASVLILPLGVLLAGPLASVNRLPMSLLVPTVLFLSMVGVFAIRNSVFDVGLALLFGVIGLVLRLNGYPVIPLVLGLILDLSRRSTCCAVSSWPTGPATSSDRSSSTSCGRCWRC